MRTLVSFLSAFFLFTGGLLAQTNYAWDCTSASSATSGSNANLTVGTWANGNSNGAVTLISTTSASTGYTGASGSSNFGVAARVGSLVTGTSGSAYFEITLTPAAGYTVTLTDFSMGSRSTSTGPQAYSIRKSTDTYTTDVATGTLTNNSTWILRSNTGISAQSAAGTAITFRIYGHSGTGTPGSGTANWRVDDIKMTLNVASTGPVPTITPASTTTTVFTTTYGTASSAQSILITGTNLSSDITATAPTGFEVSNDGTTYAGSTSFTSTSGSASGTLRIRLKADAAVTGNYNAQNIALTSTSATTVNITTPVSGNTVSAQNLTITGLTAQDKNFDGTTTATVTGTPQYVGLVNGQSFSVSGSVSWAFPSSAVGNNYTLARTGSYNSPSTNYTVTQPTLTASILANPPVINSSLTATGTYASSFLYQITGTNNPTDFSTTTLPAGLSLDFTGAISGTPSVPGTYNVDITATNTFGSDTKTLVITINKANQTISFGPLAPKFLGDPAFSLTATASSGLTVTYSSSNTGVATVSGSTVSIVGAGSTIITASQAGNSNYNPATSVDQTLTVSVLTSPTITTLGSLSAFTTTYGTASAAQSVDVSGSGLTGDITITAPAGFEVSQTDAFSGYAATQVLTQTSGSVASKTVYIRTKDNAGAGTYNSQNVVISSPGATTVNVSTTVSGNTVSPLTITLSGISISNKSYDAGLSATISGTPSLNSILFSDDVTVSGTPAASFATANVGTGISVTVSGYTLSGTQAGNYSLTQPAGLTADIIAREITVSGAVASDKTYDGTTTASISGGTLSGVQGAEAITLSTTGTFAQADAGNNIPVSVSLNGAGLSNYALTQPGLTANILKANQSITFGALPNRTTISANFKLTASSATSSVNPITYASSNPAVAVVFGDSVDIVGAGSVTITASQAGNTNYNAAADAPQTFTVTEVVAAWDFFGESSPVSSTADIYNARLDASSSLTRGSGAPSSSGSNSFRTQGFQNNGIATTNNDFFQFTLSTAAGSVISFKSIDARFAGTATFYASPGVTHQFAYSTDGTTFTLIGSPLQTTSLTPPTFDLSGVSALQNVPAATTVTFRYYASGQTTTGGWGFSSSSVAGVYGLAIGADIVSVPSLSAPTAVNITATTADLGATVDNNGGSALTSRGTVWGTSANPTGNALAEGGTTTGTYFHTRSSLTPNTFYAYRGYAVNAIGTAYSPDGTFRTLAAVPGTPTVNNPTSTTLDVTLSANGNPASTEFAIQETGSGQYVQADGTLGASAVWNTASGWGSSARVTVNGLTISTTYTFQVKARNADNVETAFSGTASETTAAANPTITLLGSPSVANTIYGTPGTAASFTASGSFLTGDITLTAPAGYELSQTSSTTGFAASQILTAVSGSVSTTTMYVRLTGAAAGTFGGNIQATSTGAATASLNLPNATVNTLALTVSGLTADNKTYDASAAATLSGTATLNGVINSDDVSLSGTPSAAFNNKNVGTSKPVTVTGYALSGTAASNYSLTAPSGLSADITAASLTVSGALVSDKTFDSTTVASVTAGTLVGVLGTDMVTLSATGSFASPFAGTGIAVTLTITGTDAGNYNLVQPGVTANINKANQTITFNALVNRRNTETRFTLFATSTSRLPVSFSSANPGVISLLVDTAFIVDAGSSVITASQAGDANYNPATSVDRTQVVVAVIAEWSFNGVTTTNTGRTPVLSAGSAEADLGGQPSGTIFTANHANALTVWSNPAGNGSAKSISANTWALGDYYQFKVNTTEFYNIGVSFDQTGSNTGPNAFKLQYSTDGVTYSDFGAPYAITNDSWNVNTVRTQSIKSFDLSSVTALNNRSEVYFRVVCASTTAISGTFGSGGTNRIDNFSVNGSLCEPTTSSQSETRCDSYVWNGTTYTSSGTYTFTTRNAIGCDSVATLILTINTSSTSTTNITRCSNQLPYSWNGNNYSAAGTYNATLVNAAGCDSVATLVLTVNNTSSSSTPVTICSNQLPYSWNGNSYSAAGTYNVTLTNTSGCDSVATLVLTVNNTSSSSTPVTICSNQLPYSWNGNSYNAAGSYNVTLVNVAGCDSVATLVLTVNARPTGVLSGSGNICNGASSNLSIAVTGAGPWSGTLSNGQSFSGSSSPIVVAVSPSATTSYSIATLSDANCSSVSGDLSGSATVTVNVRPTGVISGSGVYCAGNATPTVLSIAVTGNGPWSGTLSNGQPFSGSSSPISVTVPIPASSTTYTIATLSDANCSALAGDLSGSGSVSINSRPTAVISGTTQICGGQSANLTITMTGVAPFSGVYSDGTSNISFTSATTVYTVAVTPTAANTTYTMVSVTDANACGSTGGDISGSATVTVNPYQPEPVQGLGNVCPFIGTNTVITYTVPAVPGAISYNWTFGQTSASTLIQLVDASGNPITYSYANGYNTPSNVVRVKFLAGFANQLNKQIRVRVTTSCGTSAQRIFYVSAQRPGSPLPIVASSTNVCPSLGTSVPITYTIPAVSAAQEYVWAITTGGVPSTTAFITHPNGTGVNDTTIAVTFASNFSTSVLTVYAVNECGVSPNSRSFTISRNNLTSAGLISGPTNACEFIGATGVNATYSVPLNTLVDSYTWTLPAGSTNISGQGTRTISFRYPAGFTTGTVSVTATNGCGTSPARSLNVSRLLVGMPGLIDVANTSLCPNRVYTYTIASTPNNATLLKWKIPAGGTIVGAPVGSDSILTTATSITVSYVGTDINGVVSVQALNNCSVSAIRSISVKLLACPSGFAPNGSNPLTKGEVSPAPASNMEVKVFPNPTTSTFNLQVVTAGREEIGVRVLDVQGRVIRTMTVMPYQSVNLGAELKAGSYLVEVRQGQRVKTTRVLKF